MNTIPLVEFFGVLKQLISIPAVLIAGAVIAATIAYSLRNTK